MRKYAREYVQKYPSIAKIYRPQNRSGTGKYSNVKGEGELVRRLDDGWSLIETLGEDKLLMKT